LEKSLLASVSSIWCRTLAYDSALRRDILFYALFLKKGAKNSMPFFLKRAQKTMPFFLKRAQKTMPFFLKNA
jgi:hypothetical protein